MAKLPLIIAAAITSIGLSPVSSSYAEGRAKRTQLGRQTAYANSRLMWRYQRVKLARTLLKTPINYQRAKAIHQAHKIGRGEPGRNPKHVAGVNPNGTTNYTVAQLRRKAAVLHKAGFSRSEIRTLFDHGVVGSASKGRPSFYRRHPLLCWAGACAIVGTASAVAGPLGAGASAKVLAATALESAASGATTGAVLWYLFGPEAAK
jgi:hypothetical protein